MRNLIKSKVITILCLIALILVTVMPGCSGTKITVTRELPRELDKLSLVEMWNVVAEAADIQERSAELGSFHLRADEDGSVSSMYFDFQGRNEEGRPCIYFAEMGRNGKIDIREYETNSVSPSTHPSTVFSEIDKLGLASLGSGEAGLSLQIGFQWGNLGYSCDYVDIYHLEAGELLPLQEIVFHIRDPLCIISVFKLYPVAVEEGSMASSVKTDSGPVLPGERTSQTWFLSGDINKAEVVEYLESSGEVEVGQVLDIRVGLGLQTSLVKGISFENVKVQVGTLEEGPVWNPWKGSTYYKGDRCLLVLGDIKNDTSENLTVAGSATGYNSDWERVAWTLSSARITGQFEYSIPSHSTRSFEIILSYAEDVRFIEIGAASYSEPMFQFTPSKPLPESELTHITFTKDWLLKNDVEPDPWTVKITFPASWTEKSPPISANEEGVELTVPTQLLQDHNESTNPDQITVSFPNYYFRGLLVPPVP